MFPRFTLLRGLIWTLVTV